MSDNYILVLYYSNGGSIKKMAQAIAKGIELAGGNARLRTVPKVATVVTQAEPSIPDQGDLYCTKEDLANCQGLALGSPTHFGNMATPLKFFIDSTSDLWLSGQLIDKPATVFTSSSSLHGGQESTLLSMMLPLFHHGMVMCGVPYSNAELSSTQTGGTPYGVSHVAGMTNDTALSGDEEQLCVATGKRLATLASKLSC